LASSPTAPKARPSATPTICLEGVDRLGPHNHGEISIDSHASVEDVNCIGANDWAGVADLLFSSSQKPANAGGFLIAAGNTNYPAFDLVEHRWPRPGVQIGVEMAQEAKRCHFKRLGVLGRVNSSKTRSIATL
jgi:aspartate racemase